MAANSGGSTSGVDWNKMIKPFVTYSVGSLAKQEAVVLVKAIIENEKDLLESTDPSHPHNIFYDTVSVLAAHVITAAASSDLLPRSNFPLVCEAARILCESLVKRMANILRSPHPVLSTKTFVTVMQEFCTGEVSVTEEEVGAILALLKFTELPPKILSSAPNSWDKECTLASGKEVRRNRLDPSVLLYDQISVPMLSIPAGRSLNELLAHEVVQLFQNLKAGQNFVNLVIGLPSIKPYVPAKIDLQEESIWNMSQRCHFLRNASTDLAALTEDFNLIFRFMSLPLLAPLNTEDSQHLNQLGVAALNVAFAVVNHFHSVGTASKPGSSSIGGDPEYTIALNVLAQAIWLQKQILHIFKEDEGLPHWTWVNSSLVFSKVLFVSMQVYMAKANVSEYQNSSRNDKSTGQEKCLPRVVLSATQQVWNELAISIMCHGVDLLQSFITLAGVPGNIDSTSEIGGHNLTNFSSETKLTEGERMQIFFTGTVNVVELTVQTVTLSYRKACKLKTAKVSRQDGGLTSESNTKAMLSLEDDSNGNNLDMTCDLDTLPIDFTNDGEAEVDNNSVSDLMTTEDEEDRDDENDGELDPSYETGGDYDDEPFLGKWFQSVLNPPEASVDDNDAKSDKKGGAENAGADELRNLMQKYVVSRDDPYAIINGTLVILKFLTKHLLASKNPVVKKILLSSLNEQTAALFALILKDLDQEKGSTDIGAISSVFDDALNNIFVDFSAEFGKLVQNLLAQGILSTTVLQCLLEQLGIDLASNGRWNLGLQPRALAVLVQVILLKAQERETLVVSILRRTLETLVDDISTFGSAPNGYADLPVEHAQTLVFLFHTLSLMQKKAIMIETAKAVISVSNRLNGKIQQRHQLLSLSRLLLLFDYFIRQLYEPSLSLISHVQYNLFNDDGSSNQTLNSKDNVQIHNVQPKSGSRGTAKKESDLNVPNESYQSSRNFTTPNNLNAAKRSIPDDKHFSLPVARLFYDNPVSPSPAEKSGDRSYDLRPKFYNLIKVEPNFQENPRLDGLAMNFLMNKNDANFKDKVSYQDVMEAVLKFIELNVEDKENTGTQQYIQYFLTRLIFGLPPPHEFLLQMEEFGADFEWITARPAFVLYLIVWLPRLQNRIYVSWIRDIFSKQGLTTSQSDDIAKRAGVASFSANFVLPILKAVPTWVSKASVASPVYFLAVEAALTFAHESMEEYFVPDCSQSETQEKKEREYIQIFIRILSTTLDTIRMEVCEKGFINPKKIPLNETAKRANCFRSVTSLLSVASNYLQNNKISKMITKYLDPELELVINQELPRDFQFGENQPEFNYKKFNSDVIPGESYLLAIVNGYAGQKVSKTVGLKHVLSSIVKLCGSGINGKNWKKIGIPAFRVMELHRVLHPLLLDRVVEFMGNSLGACIDSQWGNDAVLGKPLQEIIATTTLQFVVSPEMRVVIPERNHNNLLEDCLASLTTSTDFQASDYANVLMGKNNSGELLLAVISLLHTVESEGVMAKLCDFLSMIFESPAPEQHELANWLKKQCNGEGLISCVKDLPDAVFKLHFYMNENTVEACCKMLTSLSTLLRLGDKNTRKVSVSLLRSCITIVESNLEAIRKTEKKGNEITSSFPHILKLLISIAGQADGPEGHTFLFRQMARWFMEFREDLDIKLTVAVKQEAEKSAWITSAAILTEYMLDVGKALQAIQNSNFTNSHDGEKTSETMNREGTPGSISPPNETEDNFDLYDSEIGDEPGNDDEDSGGEDSDDEGLNGRLCTYTITQKAFMSQHWYHCHTCDMTDSVGVCSVCARVCHRGHDVTYAKFGSFFCDCGAKTDGSCLALVRRTNTTANDQSGSNALPATAHVNAIQEANAHGITSSSLSGGLSNTVSATSESQEQRRASSPTVLDYKSALTTAAILFRNHGTRDSQSETLSSKDFAKKEKELKQFNWDDIMSALKEFSVKLPQKTIEKFVPVVQALADTKTPIGAYVRVRSALQKLRYGNEALAFSYSEELMIPTLGSQEGAFENIKMQYNGDQGSTIRQLINTQVIRRTTIASLSAPAARRNYLAVSQEKGKLTILQLGALLSGAEVGKKKLTLPRLATLSLPFTALTMATNTLRDDVIAVCGLKDCHVLVIGTGGTITNHFVLQPQLESQNHIIKPLWIPGSQTELAILTSDAVKIYDLGKDTMSPIFYFLLPTGKVRDATFVVQDKYRYIVIMSFEGRIFYEKLSDNTSASHGYYYVTNDLNFQDTEMLVNENTSGSSDTKGVSIYYSHALKLLFYTYPNGKSYVGTLDDLELNNPLSKGVLISPKSNERTNGKTTNLGLAYWTEVIGHPGLIFAMGQNSVPYVLLMTEKGSFIQEFRMVGKVKPIDIVALRHWAKLDKVKTSLLILCDDGSLRVCDASETTEFWLNPRLRPHLDTAGVKPLFKKGGTASKRMKQVAKIANGKLVFPVDFFEHCQPIPDVEFGGNDLLQIYNPAQIRNRLNSPQLYIVATKPIGFNLEITCNDGSMVITGARILLGTQTHMQDANRVPTFIQVFGRTINVALTKARWYDIPFTREESIQADSKVTITFGPSNDNQCITFVDSVKVYGKTKDSFGWPEDSDELVSQSVANNIASASIDSPSVVANGIASGTNSSNVAVSSTTGNPASGKGNPSSLNSLVDTVISSGRDDLVEKIVTNVLELCEIAVTLFGKDINEPHVLDSAVNTITAIYLENYPPVNSTCRSFMATVLANKGYYHEYKDSAVFCHYMKQIKSMKLLMEEAGDKVGDVDPEAFHHIVSCIKNIAVARPLHLINYDYASWNVENNASYDLTTVVLQMVHIFTCFVNQRPDNPHIVSVDRPGIQRVETMAMCLADMIYSLMNTDITLVNELSRPLFELLLSSHKDVSVPVRQLFTKRLRPKSTRKRRVAIPGPSPPHCASPDTAAESPREASTPSGNSSRNIADPANLPLVEVDAPIVMLGQDNEGQMPMLNPLDAFMGPDGFIAPGMDMQSDAEDEAMVELAIALSLQEQVGGAALAIQGIQEGLQALEDMHQEVLHVAEAMSPPEEEPEQGGMDGVVEAERSVYFPSLGGAESDATASPPPSDDEGSTVATEGSTMRNSEPGGSESSGSSGAGGSGNSRNIHSRSNDHLHRVGSSSSDAQQRSSSVVEVSAGESARGLQNTEKDGITNSGKAGTCASPNAKPFRLALMKVISDKITHCQDPLSTIPLLQVLLVIITELDGSSSEERQAIEFMVNQLLIVMNLEVKMDLVKEWERDHQSEITLISLRMLSILVSRWRQPDVRPENNWISRITAELVYRKGLVSRCKDLLFILRSTWKGNQEGEESSLTNGAIAIGHPAPIADGSSTLLRPSVTVNPPDYGPFFLKQYVKSHSHDILEELPLLLSEMALRFPYQVKKIIYHEAVFDPDWEELLCEMLQNRNAPFVRRQARKLLLNIAGTREQYHLLRDLHNIKHNLSEFKKLIGFDGVSGIEKGGRNTKLEFKYSQLVSMVEHLNTCIDIATQRSASWQAYCKTEDALEFILQMSCNADESLTTAILTLLKIAVDGIPFDSKAESTMLALTDEEKVQKSLAHKLIDNTEKRTFLEFVKKFLLEHPVLSTRWQAHALLLGFFQTSDCAHQLKLVHAMWELWPFVPAAGIRAAQFVDILGYATLNNDHLKSTDLRSQVSYCIRSIESQGNALLAHPNACIYSSLVPFVSVEGFYLESEPCEVCYNIDKPYATQKLVKITADGKFTANSQIFKLASTWSVIRLSIRLTDVKKARMIKSMAVYYSPKNLLSSIVELKNKPNLWQMARRVVLSPSQTEVKLDFSVPIVAANIMLEFLEFYENVQATSETLQCPRCSASVPAQPGVCSNCGENVYQCHKCRAINYDERDPFLCHSCGFCKYAKMDISVLAKNIVAVDPIENEEDHKKAETAVSTLLEKADQTYKQQQQMKGCLETMLQSIKERRSMAGVSLTATSSASGSATANLSGIPAPQSYAAAASAVPVPNNNNGNGTVAGGSAVALATAGGSAGSATSQLLTGGAGGSSLVLKNVQSLAYCYAIDCKNSYEELNRLMRKVSAYRKEMLKMDPTSYSFDTMDNVTYRRCYGCMASSITLSLKLLQALITAGSPRDPFDPFFLSFLLRLSQSAGSTALKEQVKNALCFFVKDDSVATIQLTSMITSRVMAAYNKETWSDVSFETSEEISLLASLLQMYDSCWEIKLRSLMEIFTHAIARLKDPSVTETSLLPCLKIIQNFIRATHSGDKDKATISAIEGVSVNMKAWLSGDENHSFEKWKKRLPKILKSGEESKSSGLSGESAGKKIRSDPKSKKTAARMAELEKDASKGAPTEDGRTLYLMRTYGRRWLQKHYKLNPSDTLNFEPEFIWIKKLIFCPGSVQTRVVTAALLKDLSQIPQRRLKIMELLTKFMEDLPTNGECCREFMELYRDLATPSEYSAFLNAKGALNIVCKLLDGQIDRLHYLEAVTLHSDLSQGIAIWELSRLLSALAIPSVRRNKRVSLLSTVLGGYLALKRLRLHRTRPIEEAQEILLQLLEEITSGTEEETKIFMSVCVETLKKCPKDDLTTPVFVFERLCSLIFHEENDVAEFFVSLEKDPQQEDFLNGRMLGNPYSSNETGIGPLMRDIKNKICTDCELVALLEDDNGMELLVNNRIISLDLPVKEVYKRIWLPTNGQIEPMRIVYRMRGLLGDATEEFVESFVSPTDDPEDKETTYKLANVLVDCGGLQVALNALENLLNQQFLMSRAKPLIAVILKLLGYSAKIKKGRVTLVNPELNAVQILLPILRLCLQHEMTSIQGSSGVVHLTDQVLEILDVILTDACTMGETAFKRFAVSRGSLEDVRNLLALTHKLKSRQNTMSVYLKVLACLTYMDKQKMIEIFESFADCWNFFKYDNDPSPEFGMKLEQLCTLVGSIQPGPYGNSFKDLAVERNDVDLCLEYVKLLAPNLKPPLGRPDSDEWKEMVSKPSLKYVLRLLAGFGANHPPTQEALKEIIYVVHQLEQVSSDEYVGSLAENVLEALRSHDKIWKEVEGARRATREEKKRMAMAMREKQLLTMGMRTNDKGQVTAAASTMLEHMEKLEEETGLICVICREGYKYQPTKVLGIYTYSKRCLLEKAETKTRKTFGYCTVSHFNVVHVDCHMAAIRLARSRDEWESASLQNANTRCNGLIPLWGVQVPEPSFAACLARHNAYLQEATGCRDVGFSSGIHDIKLLLLRFAEESSFHEDAGGGGPESNMHLVPYLIHTALYVLNTTRAATKESRNAEIFLFLFPHIWKEDAYAVEGVYYHLVVFLVVNSIEKWMQNRMQWLKRVLAMNGLRSKKQRGSKLDSYRAGLIFMCIIHGLYTKVFKDVSGSGEWPSMLADFIRKNDEPLLNSTTTLLTLYQQKMLAAETFEEFFEILGMSDEPELKDPDEFISKLWDEMSSS